MGHPPSQSPDQLHGDRVDIYEWSIRVLVDRPMLPRPHRQQDQLRPLHVVSRLVQVLWVPHQIRLL